MAEKSGLKKLFYVFVSLLIIGVLAAAAGCGGGGTITSASPSSTVATSTADDTIVILTVVNGSQTKTYTMRALQNLPAVSGWAGSISASGTVTGPFEDKGVAISDLVKEVGGITDKNAVKITGKDGSSITLSYAQVTQGTFDAIDVRLGLNITVPPSATPIAFIAYQMSGKPISEDIGPLVSGVIIFVGQVTQQQWWVNGAQKVEVVPAA